MVDRDSDAETDIDLIWAAIAGLRQDIGRLTGRLERMSQAPGSDTGKAEEAAEAWRAERERQIEALMEVRKAQGKSDELDDEDIENIGNAWLCS